MLKCPKGCTPVFFETSYVSTSTGTAFLDKNGDVTDYKDSDGDFDLIEGDPIQCVHCGSEAEEVEDETI